MKNLIQFFLRNNKFTLIMLIIVALIGIRGAISLNSESYPTVNLGKAIVVTPYPGAGPEDVEANITKVIEDKVRKVRGLKEVTSVSQIGISRVVVRADIDNYDVSEVMDEVEKAVKSVGRLPPGVPRPQYVEINSEEFPALEMAVVGSNENRRRDRYAYRLKEMIEDIKGVLKADLKGYREREFSIYLDQKKLNKFHVGADEVVQTLRLRNMSIPAGDLVGEKEQLLIRLDGKTDNIKELLMTPVRSNYSGNSVLLRDVSQVVDGEEDAKKLASVNGEKATLLIITKRAGSDTIALATEIQKLLKAQQVPDGLKIEIYNNMARKVKNRTEVLISNAYIGLGLVIAFMLIFLPGKVGLVAALSLPVALVMTFGTMPHLGMNLNAVTIIALVIALGMLVDNSVVITENYVRLREEGMNAHDAACKAAHQFWLPITCTALTTIAGFMPMLVTKGLLGQFIRYIPIIVSLSLVASLLESFFLLPMRLRGVDGSKKKNEVKSNWFKVVAGKFEVMMGVLIHHRYIVAVGFGLVLFGSVYLLVKVNKFVLFPSDQTEIYVGRFVMEKGTTLKETQRASQKLSRQVKEVLGDDAEFIVAIAGKSEKQVSDPKSKEGDNVGILKVFVTPAASFSLYYSDALAKMRGLDTSDFKQVTFETVVNGPPVGVPVNMTLRSHNGEQLEQLSKLLLVEVKKIEGIITPEVNDTFGDSEVEVILDHEKMLRLGLSVAQVGSTIKDLFEGRVITNLNLNNRKFNIRIRLKNNDKKYISNLSNITVMDRRGNLIKLSQFAQLKKKDGALVIKRYDYQRAKTLTADIDLSQVTSGEANSQAIDLFNEIQKDYPEVSLAIGGQEKNTRESMQSLAQAMGLALIGIFGVMVFLFRSYLRPLIIMSTIPLGITGVSIAFYFHDKPVSFLAMIGVIGLAGIIVNSGIVLISFIDQLRQETDQSLHSILVKASGLRLKAVIVTSLTTISGLIPTAYGWGGADLVLMPMTLAMAWGLVTGTLLTLIWVPCAYALVEDFINLVARIRKKVFG